MGLADRIKNYKNEKEQAAQDAARAIYKASDRLVTDAFKRAAADEDALARAAVDNNGIRVCLAQFKEGDGFMPIARLLGARPVAKDIAENITEDMVKNNDVFRSLCRQFDVAGYDAKFQQLYTMPKNGPHGLDELWCIMSVLPSEDKCEPVKSNRHDGQGGSYMVGP